MGVRAGNDHVIIRYAGGFRDHGAQILCRPGKIAHIQRNKQSCGIVGSQSKNCGMELIVNAERGPHGGVAHKHGAKRRSNVLLPDANHQLVHNSSSFGITSNPNGSIIFANVKGQVCLCALFFGLRMRQIEAAL